MDVIYMARRLRIALLTNGRFHLLDLARELAALGHEVRFYSLVPPWRTRKFGLPSECNRWLMPWVSPAFALHRLGRNTSWKTWGERKVVEELDRTAARVIEACDVFIGMSGMCNRAAAVVKRRYGAKVWIERASRHIVSQKAILDAIPGADTVPEYALRRELFDYDQADIVNVPAEHCVRSFLEQGFESRRLVRNPFGVDLGQFPLTPTPHDVPLTVIMAGTWCRRKGCDTLAEAWRTLNGVRLLHVGSVTDCPLPGDANFVHHDKIDQTELSRMYAYAHVFALASREEGLAFVQPQSLACGLRLVCTDRTGGADLGELIADPSAIRVVPSDDPLAFAAALQASLNEARNETGLRDRLGDKGRAHLTWTAYARRYERNLFAGGPAAGQP